MSSKPLLQVALDFIDLKRAIKLAEEAVAGGCDWLEVGTPLIKSEGMNAIRELKKRFPKNPIVADMKTMDVGRAEVEMSAKAGASIVGVLGASSDETIKEAISAARNYGARIIVDMIEVKDVVKRAKEAEKMGADFIGIHIPIDEQMKGKASFDIVRKVAGSVGIPLSVAGGINSENAADVVKNGASIVVVGGAITKSKDAKKATETIKKAIAKKIKLRSEFFKRVGENEIADVLSKVSAANISDALHRCPPLEGLLTVCSGAKIFGRAVTVRTYPGDWAKPVEAIDIAAPGDVIVIDAGGVGPAVWGELATRSAMIKKIAGVVIDGAIRDVADIKKLKFPAFAKIITPQAGEPKGFGEINVPVTICGIKVFPGDLIFGDDDGVMVIPKDIAAESANRAMDVFEKENRLRAEINSGQTLADLTELLKWEKK